MNESGRFCYPFKSRGKSQPPTVRHRSARRPPTVKPFPPFLHNEQNNPEKHKQALPDIVESQVT